ncbi:hypothetical protein [Pseudalkalibacillus sp. SCS-8]|uniref:hypothetical protein n=1 Tax=Pseudalkalibacillus nanhaiensis TaxID=3115291 RepID=UPI0032DA8F64
MNELIAKKKDLNEQRYKLLGKGFGWFLAFGLLGVVSSFIPLETLMGKILYYSVIALIIYVWIRFAIICIKTFILTAKVFKTNTSIYKAKRRIS